MTVMYSGILIKVTARSKCVHSLRFWYVPGVSYAVRCRVCTGILHQDDSDAAP